MLSSEKLILVSDSLIVMAVSLSLISENPMLMSEHHMLTSQNHMLMPHNAFLIFADLVLFSFVSKPLPNTNALRQTLDDFSRRVARQKYDFEIYKTIIVLI